jgi:hypothetical protein
MHCVAIPNRVRAKIKNAIEQISRTRLYRRIGNAAPRRV